MSNYVDYDESSRTYDSSRFASGVDLMTQIIGATLRKDVGEVHLLDAGCGTGNYSLGFLQNGIGTLTMLDASNGMLERAKGKVVEYKERISEIKQHLLPILPFPDNTFDAVALIQVIHHLDTYHMNVENIDDGIVNGDAVIDDAPSDSQVEKKYPNSKLALKEAYRVLKPNGVLLMDHVFKQNMEASWMSLTPESLYICKALMMSEDILIDMLTSANFKNVFYVTRPGSRLTEPDVTDNPELFLDKSWRDTSSEWRRLEQAGLLAPMLEMVQKKKDEGVLNEFAHEQNKLFRLVGYSTMVFAQKL